MRKIIIISSYRMLLIYLLIEKIDIFTPQYIFEEKFNVEMIKQLIFCVKKYDVKTKNYLKKIYYKLMKFIEIKKFLYKNNLMYDSIIYGAEHIGIGSYLVKRNNFYILEDGVMNYLEHLYVKNWKDMLLFRKKMGLHRNVKKIYLTELAEIPKVIKDKVEIINLEELWNKKSEDEKKAINKIFKLDTKVLQKIADRKIILFTQSLSEDEIISEEEKLELYSKILARYQQKNIVIKPHPREKTDYSSHFPNCYVMKEKYPIELLIFNGLKIDRAITLFSTAIFSLNKNVKVDFYGTEVHPKLLERFGSMENIIKKNCYL